jgi:hypothetical protein
VLLNDPILNQAVTKKIVRRRRSWYRRRLRMRRILLAVFVGTIVAASCWQNLARHFSLPTLHASQVFPESFWRRTQVGPNARNTQRDLAFAAARSSMTVKVRARIPGVYPYSVVPGGIRNAAELREAAARDYAIRRHYAQFDFEHARMLRATEARAVYLSYRIRNTVFWTRKRVRLQVGELLLTDGNITARARCGNQISDVARPEVSNEEPDEDVLDQPVAAVDLPAAPPIRPALSAPDLPSGVPTAPRLFAGGFVFPYAPYTMPSPNSTCSANYQLVDGKCKIKHKNPVAPEPETIWLITTGLAIVLWRYRKAVHPVAA